MLLKRDSWHMMLHNVVTHLTDTEKSPEKIALLGLLLIACVFIR